MFFIRSAGEADLAKVAVFLTGAWQSVRALKAKLEQPGSEFVVADDGKRIGGMAYAAMDKDEGDVVVLQQLRVDPQLTGQGIGRDLFAEIETCFPAAKRIRVEVPADSDKAMRFFNGLGFAEIGWSKIAGAPASGTEALVFEKELNF